MTNPQQVSYALNKIKNILKKLPFQIWANHFFSQKKKLSFDNTN